MSVKCKEVTAAQVRKQCPNRRSKLCRGMQVRKRALTSMGWRYHYD